VVRRRRARFGGHPIGNPGRVPEPSRDGTRRAELADSPRDQFVWVTAWPARSRSSRRTPDHRTGPH
jgi:hypothetical protein